MIKLNAAQCRLCKDYIVSRHRHDFRSCSCGEIFIDGGLDYLRRGAKNPINLIPLTMDDVVSTKQINGITWYEFKDKT